ncbi:MAG TPA: DUF481 domain-containing protein [Pseudobdellovibrionaceae bacterium]|nr:DUF481 domain-containing protein [Pseudobdellovibrionaceae bacterium]
MISRWPAALLLIGLCTPAAAFINIETLRRNAAEGLSGALNLQANGQSGNTEKFTGEVSSLNLYRSSEKEYIFLANYKYGESNRLRDTHQGSMHLRLARSWTSFPTTEVFAQTQFDQFKLLKSRDLLGGGLRFHWSETKKSDAYFGSGLFHEWERIKEPGSNQEDWRGNFYLSYLRFLDELWMTSLTLYYQPAFDDVSDFRLHTELGLELKLTTMLALTLKSTHQCDSAPPPTVRRQDLSYLAGLSLKF